MFTEQTFDLVEGALEAALGRALRQANSVRMASLRDRSADTARFLDTLDRDIGRLHSALREVATARTGPS
jgi:hypothetical protein